jgi:hypothetical protein
MGEFWITERCIGSKRYEAFTGLDSGALHGRALKEVVGMAWVERAYRAVFVPASI